MAGDSVYRIRAVGNYVDGTRRETMDAIVPKFTVEVPNAKSATIVSEPIVVLDEPTIQSVVAKLGERAVSIRNFSLENFQFCIGTTNSIGNCYDYDFKRVLGIFEVGALLTFAHATVAADQLRRARDESANVALSEAYDNAYFLP